MGNDNFGMKRKMLSHGHIIWMMWRTASKTICLLCWQNCGQIIAVKSVALCNLHTYGMDGILCGWNWSLVIDHNHKRNFENNISLEQLITPLPHQRVVWQLWPSDQLPLFQILSYWKRSTRSNQSHAGYDAEAKNLFDKSICPILLLISQISPGCIWRSNLLKFLGKEKRIADGSFQYRGKAGLICGSRERWMGLAGKNINRNWWGKCHGFHKNAFS